jgi:gliding motility-associated-like protein
MIKLYKTLLLFLLLFCSFSSYAQPDCVDAINICEDQPLVITPNGAGSVIELTTGSFSNPSTNPGPVNSVGTLNAGCLLSAGPNPTWMIINIAASGSLEFTFGADASTGCLDWIMWPYSPTACNEIIANTLAPIRCNWNGACEGFTGMATVLPAGASPTNFEAALSVIAGQQFIICLSNYSSVTNPNLQLNFFQTTPGTANISCTPVLPLTVNNASICPGESVILTANIPGNPSTVSYSWSTGETTQSITVSPISSTTYTVSASGFGINGAPISNSATSTVTVNAPINPTFSQILPFCNNSVVTAVLPTNSTNLPPIPGTWNPPTVSSATVGSQVYTFTPTNIYCANTATMTVITIPNGTASLNPINTLCINSVPPLLSSTSSNAVPYQGTWNPPIISTAIAGIFPYTFTPAPGLCGAPSTINITIQEVAAFSQIPQLCQDDLNPILPTISNNTPGITGVWTPATIDSSIPGVITHTFLPNSGQCQTTVDMTIVIVPAIPPSFIADTLTGCNPLPVNFSTINPIPGANYTWFWNNTEIGTGANYSHILDASGFHDITLEYELSSCFETTTYDDYIFMENDPIASFTFNPAVISSEIEEINFLNSSIGAVSYLWDFGDNSSSTVQNTSHTYTGASDNILVSLTASTPLGCFDIYEMTIVVLSEAIFYIPNTFTPDEDEHNQLWRPIFTSGFDIYSFNLEIYNRWGETIWETNDASAGWDGTYGIDGLKVPSGIYNWTIRYGSKINDDTKQVNGFVNVLY